MLGDFPDVGYSTWGQTAGYFDGDGSIDVTVRRNTLRFRLTFVDNQYSHLAMIRRFILQSGVRNVSPVRKRFDGAYRVEIGAISDIVEVCKKLQNFLFKKRDEVIAVIGYYEDRITADEAISIFNRKTIEGSRLGKLRKTDIPYTHKKGASLAIENARVLTSDQIRKIKFEHDLHGVSMRRLAISYGVARRTIRNVLRK